MPQLLGLPMQSLLDSADTLFCKRKQTPVPTRVLSTGTRPDYLANRAAQKNERPFRAIALKSRNNWRLSGGGVGAH